MARRQENRVALSFCLIVRDRARVLEPCLLSIRPWVDEMIVVDTGSVDDTPQIAQRLGAKVFHFTWCDDFAAAHNDSLRHAGGGWLFWMDSDDSIDPENGRKLRELANRPLDQSPMAYVMQVHYTGPDAGERGDVKIYNQVKMFRNDPRIQFDGRLHMDVMPSIQRFRGRVERTDVFVVHSGCDHTPEAQRRRFERNLRIMRLEEAERPDNPLTLFNLGRAYADVNRHAEAIPILRRSIELASPEVSQVPLSYAEVIASFVELGQVEAAWRTCQESRRLFPRNVELLFWEGVLAHRLGRLADAARAYRAVLAMRQEQHVVAIDPAVRGYKAHQNLAGVYNEMGRPELAEPHWRQVLAECPFYKDGWRGLCGSLLRQRRFTEAEADARRLLDQPRLRGLGRVLLACVAWTRGDSVVVRRELAEAAAEFPDDPDVAQARRELLSDAVRPAGTLPAAQSRRNLAAACENSVVIVGPQ